MAKTPKIVLKTKKNPKKVKIVLKPRTSEMSKRETQIEKEKEGQDYNSGWTPLLPRHLRPREPPARSTAPRPSRAGVRKPKAQPARRQTRQSRGVKATGSGSSSAGGQAAPGGAANAAGVSPTSMPASSSGSGSGAKGAQNRNRQWACSQQQGSQAGSVACCGRSTKLPVLRLSGRKLVWSRSDTGPTVDLWKIYGGGRIKSIRESPSGFMLFDRERDEVQAGHEFLEYYYKGHLVRLDNLTTQEVVYECDRALLNREPFNESLVADVYLRGRRIAAYNLITGKFTMVIRDEEGRTIFKTF